MEMLEKTRGLKNLHLLYRRPFEDQRVAASISKLEEGELPSHELEVGASVILKPDSIHRNYKYP